jgi:hypothetical protein
VRNLGKTSTFISVEVDVINIERSSLERRSSNVVAVPIASTSFTEFKVDFNFVVLKSNEGESKTGVAAKPEFKGNV